MQDSRLSSRALALMLGDWRTGGTAYAAIADRIRVFCLDNRIAAGTVLPAERDLAMRIGVSRTTIATAYSSLRASGHIESLRGSGSVVRAQPRGVLIGAGEPVGEGLIDLHQASPAAWPGLPGLYVEAAAQASSVLARPGYDMVGAPGLREAIAARYEQRGLPTDPDQIVVTNGAQSAISLIAATFVRRGDRVMIETPTYPHAAEALRRRDARLVSVPVSHEDGWDVERAEHVFRRAMPSLAYLMPDFQNPTGRIMPGEHRALFAAMAAEVGAMVLIDETTAELNIDGPEPLAPFAAFSPADSRARIITIGSLGKTVWGGLRVGWIRAEHELARRLVATRPLFDLGTPDMEQAVATLAFERMPEILAQRAITLGAGRDAVVTALRERLPEWTVHSVHGGVATWVGLGAPRSSQLVLGARARGVLLSSGPRFAVDGGYERHLRIPFTADPDSLLRAVDVIADAWADASAGGFTARDGSLAEVV